MARNSKVARSKHIPQLIQARECGMQGYGGKVRIGKSLTRKGSTVFCIATKMDAISGVTENKAADYRRILGKVAHVDGGLVRECSDEQAGLRVWLRPPQLLVAPFF